MALDFTVENLDEALADYDYSAEHSKLFNENRELEYNVVTVTAGDVTLEFIFSDSDPEPSVSIDDMVEVIRYAPQGIIDDVGAEFDSVETLEELVEAIMAQD